MKEKGKITPLAQHIIDTFRTLCLENNISLTEFSRRITPSENPTRVSTIENIYNNDRYSPELIAKGLQFFGKTMEDILPDGLLDDDTLQEKTKLPILKAMSVMASLKSLIEEGYFNTPRSRSEITEYYNSHIAVENHKIDSDFTAQLEDLYNKGILIKVHIDEGTEREKRLQRFIVKPKDSKEN